MSEMSFLSEHLDQISHPEEIIEGEFINEEAEENPNFSHKNLDTLKNHWITTKGKMYKGKKTGLCKIYLFKNEWFCGNFVKDEANGKGIFFTKNGLEVKGIWESN